MDVLPLIPVAHKAARYVWRHGANEELEDLKSEATVGLLVLNSRGKLEHHPNPEALTFQACRCWLLDRLRTSIRKLNGYRVVSFGAIQVRDCTAEHKFLVCTIKTANPRQHTIVQGLYDGHTLEEIGLELGISAGRVWQILTKIRALNQGVQ